MVERIKELCDKEGITIKALEKALGFGNGTIRLWDNSSPSAAKLYLVAFYFDVSMEYLMGKEEQPTESSGLSDIAIQVARIVDQLPPESRRFVLVSLQSIAQSTQGPVSSEESPKS
jgi:transcriptional regulator with XRE-family HTH domain